MTATEHSELMERVLQVASEGLYRQSFERLDRAIGAKLACVIGRVVGTIEVAIGAEVEALRRENIDLDAKIAIVRAGLADIRSELDAQLAVRYHDDSFPERKCDYCGVLYRGPAVYCSPTCAQADGAAP